jgi:hypothetical protein
MLENKKIPPRDYYLYKFYLNALLKNNIKETKTARAAPAVFATTSSASSFWLLCIALDNFDCNSKKEQKTK